MAQQSPTSSDLWLLDGVEDFRTHALALAAKAHRRIEILCQDLDAPVYGQNEFIETLSNFMRSSRNAQIQVLIRDTKLAKELGHPLIRLSQRLSSKIQLRKLILEPENNEREFMCCDTDGLLYKNDFSVYQGFANYAALREVKQMREEFNYLWEYGETDPDLQLLQL
jgi:hypothetical protein